MTVEAVAIRGGDKTHIERIREWTSTQSKLILIIVASIEICTTISVLQFGIRISMSRDCPFVSSHVTSNVQSASRSTITFPAS